MAPIYHVEVDKHYEFNAWGEDAAWNSKKKI